MNHSNTQLINKSFFERAEKASVLDAIKGKEPIINILPADITGREDGQGGLGKNGLDKTSNAGILQKKR